MDVKCGVPQLPPSITDYPLGSQFFHQDMKWSVGIESIGGNMREWKNWVGFGDGQFRMDFLYCWDMGLAIAWFFLFLCHLLMTKEKEEPSDFYIRYFVIRLK